MVREYVMGFSAWKDFGEDLDEDTITWTSPEQYCKSSNLIMEHYICYNIGICM